MLNWTPNEALYFVILLLVLYRLWDTIGAFVDDRVQDWYRSWRDGK